MKFSLVFLAILAVSGVAKTNAVPVRSSSELHDVLDEFLALVPKDKIVQIFLEYLEKDVEVQTAIEYMASDGFKELVAKVESIEDVINFYNYLDESGLDIYSLVNKLHEFIDMPPLEPAKNYATIEITGGITGLFEDIMAVLPLEDIKALYREKLKTSPAFAELVERLSSPRFQELIDALRANVEFRKIVQYFLEVGVDLTAIKNLLSAIFGLEFPDISYFQTLHKRNDKQLVQDFADFMEILPIVDMVDVAADYVFNDPEVQNAAVYVKSQEFKRLATNAQQNVEFRDFVEYFQASGIEAYEYVNRLNRYLEIPEVRPLAVHGSRIDRRGGVRGMLDDIESLLPREAIRRMFEHKLQTSEPFKRFVSRLRAPEFQAVVDRLVANQDFQKLGYRAADFGIDLAAIVKFMSRVFGIEISA